MAILRSSRLSRAALCVVPLLAAAFGVPASGNPLAGEPQVAPHRAAYSLQLTSTETGSKVISVDGGISYEWADTCDGWAVEQRYLMRVLRVEGPEFVIATSFATWESKDGRRYRFNVRRMRNGEREDIGGEATLNANGTGIVRFTAPEEKTLPLPAGTLFPTAHTLLLLRKAAENARFDRRPVFDGTEAMGATPVFATILPHRPASKDAKIASPLGLDSAWPVFLAFYGSEDKEALPQFEMSMTLQDNGVVTGVEFDYGDFSVEGKLDIVEPLPAPAC
ncbi:MAG: cell envelope integrity EipB family protein [Alphaproteobacteria bacterium]